MKSISQTFREIDFTKKMKTTVWWRGWDCTPRANWHPLFKPWGRNGHHQDTPCGAKSSYVVTQGIHYWPGQSQVQVMSAKIITRWHRMCICHCQLILSKASVVDILNFTFWSVNILKCKIFLIGFLDELGNFNQKLFTFYSNGGYEIN